MKNQGVIINGLVFDSMLASYLLNPDNRQHSLDAVSFRELAWEKISTYDLIGKGKDQNFLLPSRSRKKLLNTLAKMLTALGF